ALGAAGHSVWGVHPIDKRLLDLLVLSQVILSFQLPFAIVPLVQFTSDRRRMGEFASGNWLKTIAWVCAGIVVSLDGVLIYLSMGEWAEAVSESGWHPMWIYGTAGPIAFLLAGFLGWVTIYPWRRRREEIERPRAAPILPGVRYDCIGVAVELEGGDDAVLAQAAALARVH